MKVVFEEHDCEFDVEKDEKIKEGGRGAEALREEHFSVVIFDGKVELGCGLGVGTCDEPVEFF